MGRLALREVVLRGGESGDAISLYSVVLGRSPVALIRIWVLRRII